MLSINDFDADSEKVFCTMNEFRVYETHWHDNQTEQTYKNQEKKSRN